MRVEPKIGSDWPVWWNTGRDVIDGFYPAVVLGVEPYTGNFPEHFTHVLKLFCPTVPKGFCSMSVQVPDV